MLKVRFTDLRTGKESYPTVRSDKDAKYVFSYGKKVATAPFRIELVDRFTVLKKVEVNV